MTNGIQEAPLKIKRMVQLDKEVYDAGMELARRERRSFNNFLEVLIDRAANEVKKEEEVAK